MHVGTNEFIINAACIFETQEIYSAACILYKNLFKNTPNDVGYVWYMHKKSFCIQFNHNDLTVNCYALVLSVLKPLVII